MYKFRLLVTGLTLFLGLTVCAQTTFPVNGPADFKPGKYAITHAHVVTSAGHEVTDATIFVNNDVIVYLGRGLSVPADYVAIDVKGAYVYPSFIDLFSDYGLQKQTANVRLQQGPQMHSNKLGAYNWNQAVHPEVNAADLYKHNSKDASVYRQAGFGCVLTHQRDGIFRGTGALVPLADTADHLTILKPKVSAHYSFSKGSSTQDYPSSLMGAIALMRQTFYDAKWYEKQKGETNLSLQAYLDNAKLPAIIEVTDKFSATRAATIGNEFGFKFIIKGNGDEYQRIADIKALNTPVVIPVNFPQPIDVSDPYDAGSVSLAAMLHWELAPANMQQCAANNVPFAVTMDECKDATVFFKNLRKAIVCGLADTSLLQALTIVPARLLGVQDRVGTLEVGKLANFIICSGPLFSEQTTVLQNWIGGRQHIVHPFDFNDMRGHYKMNVQDGPTATVVIKGNKIKPEMKLLMGKDTAGVDIKYQVHDTWVNLEFSAAKDTTKTNYRLSGIRTGNKWEGLAHLPGGATANWTMEKTGVDSADLAEPKPKKAGYTKPAGHTLYPFVGMGYDTLPVQKDYLLTNATIWTGEADTALVNADILISGGKIKAVGRGLTSAKALRINCAGKYITAGIIDEHSHIAISAGVNEGGQSVTSEVRIGDVVNPDDINIYRQLSGGVTTTHLLHGSANCIGGQTQLIKLKFGYNAEQMKVAGWPGFIKFALGENVKQSNWGDMQRVRYPQTRMGVEQTMTDAFTRASEYRNEWKEYAKTNERQGMRSLPRRDLELDALVEIMEQKRFITCHSYVQSEINMLMKVADSFGFTVNTFTHILEGYKVADKMKKHGANASTFADWWAYKMEVADAIPYNAALMVRMGINTAINSDDVEMARRLNQEAAKGMKYGGLNKWQAWAMCTINPARMLHIDKFTGSLKVGKDADVVVWNAEPLSVYAHPMYTFVDGICFYDVESNTQRQQQLQAEKERLRAQMLEATKNNETPVKPKPGQNRLYDCDTELQGNYLENQ